MFPTRLNPTKPSAVDRAALERLGAACRAIEPTEESCYRAGRINELVPDVFRECGVLGLGTNASQDGMGGDALLLALAAERLGRVGAGLRLRLTTHAGVVGGAIRRWGTPDQRARWLPPIARGEWFVGGPAHLVEGLDSPPLRKLTCAATSAGFVLNGEMEFITSGPDPLLVLAFAAGPTPGRAIALLVDRRLPGCRVERVAGGRPPTVVRCVSRLADCEVPRANVLCNPDEGLRVAVAAAIDERLGNAAGAVGLMADCLETAAGRLVPPRADSVPAAEFAWPAKPNDHDAELAQMGTDLEAARALVYAAAELMTEWDAKPRRRHLALEAGTLVREADSFACHAAPRVAEAALRMLGAAPDDWLVRAARHLADITALATVHRVGLERQIAAYYLAGRWS